MLPKLLNYEEAEGERRWTYELEIIFNKLPISKITITDHYLAKHPEITNELIWNLMKKLDHLRREEDNYPGQRKVYKWETIYQNQSYRLIFWFKDNNANHLWIRNCYPVNNS